MSDPYGSDRWRAAQAETLKVRTNALYDAYVEAKIGKPPSGSGQFEIKLSRYGPYEPFKYDEAGNVVSIACPNRDCKLGYQNTPASRICFYCGTKLPKPPGQVDVSFRQELVMVVVCLLGELLKWAFVKRSR